MKAATSGDPHWDLVVEIAAKLWVEGQYVAEVQPTPTQGFVDLQWAARHAGRVLGGQVKVRTSPPRSRNDPTVTITATYTEPDGDQGFQSSEQGLERLMRMILEAVADADPKTAQCGG